MMKHCMGKKQIHVYTAYGGGEPELLPDALLALGDQCHGDQTIPPEEGEESNQPKHILQRTIAKKSNVQKATAQKAIT